MATDQSQTNQPMARDEIERFLAQPLVGILSWTTTRGEVSSSPVWHEYGDGKIWIASSSAFAKGRARSR